LAIAIQAQVRTEKRETNLFSEVSLRVDANLYVYQGNESSIEITGNDESLDKIIVEVNGRKLIIRFSFEDRWMSEFKPEKLEIKVISPDISSLAIQGAGNIYAKDTINTNFLDLNIAGSGDITLNQVVCERIEANISGSGDIKITGKATAKEIELDIAGSGDLVSPELSVGAARILIAGSGDCELQVSDYLDAKIFGSGDIKYKGTPTVKSSISGSGKVHNIN